MINPGFVVPLITWFLLYVVISFKSPRAWRENILVTSVVWTFLLVMMTELLSVFKTINYHSILIAWLCIVVGLFYYCRKMGISFISFYCDAISQIKKSDFIKNPIFYALALIVLTIGLISVVSAPNTWDAMTYHLPRIMHWMDQQSLHHFATHNLRQLYQPPLAEMIMMHMQLLSGHDYFTNAVQWISMIYSIVGVSLIVKIVKGSNKLQWFSALLVVTIPMGILQATSPKNDYVLTCWLVSLVYFVLRFINYKKQTDIIFIAISLGLAVLTKGTAYVFAFPIMLWFLVHVIKQKRLKLFFKVSFIIAGLFFVLNTPHYIRNFSTFKHPLGAQNTDYSNQNISVPTIFSNLLRNMALHLNVPPRSKVLPQIEKAIGSMHKLMGIDENDTKTTWKSVKFKLHRGSLFSENHSGNFIHFVLFVMVVIGYLVFLIRKRKMGNPQLLGYLIVLMSGVILFCLYLRWQPWHSRLHLPLFVLFSPFVATGLSSFHRKQYSVIAIVLFVGAIPWLLFNSSRPLVGKASVFLVPYSTQYFASKINEKSDVMHIAEIINNENIHKIGWVANEDGWEYPYWMMLDKASLCHILVGNESKKYMTEKKSPDAIILSGLPENGNMVYNNTNYIERWSSDQTVLLLPEKTVANK